MTTSRDEPPILVPFQLSTPLGELSLFTTLTTFGTPLDVTIDELAIELFFPADDAQRRDAARPRTYAATADRTVRSIRATVLDGQHDRSTGPESRREGTIDAARRRVNTSRGTVNEPSNDSQCDDNLPTRDAHPDCRVA